MKSSLLRPLLASCALTALAACTVGPDYEKPAAPVPATYKEIDGCKPATRKQAASGEPWWSIFNDPVLDGLEHQIDISNQTLKASEAAYRLSQALVDEARAGFFPTVGLGGSATRNRWWASHARRTSPSRSAAHACRSTHRSKAARYACRRRSPRPAMIMPS